MNIWWKVILSILIVSSVSLIGVLGLALRKKKLEKTLYILVSFSTGTLFGGAFLHLIPEAIDDMGSGIAFSLAIIIGILAFFMLEKFIHWRHCHVPTSSKHPHPFGLMNLVGDGIHNLIDGMLISAAYLASTQVGIATTIAVLVHEIPQEIGDFGVLLHAGYSKGRALLLNFISGMVALVGGIIILVFGIQSNIISASLLPFTAGGFIYIAGSDLIPELKKQTDIHRSLYQLIFILFGILVMYLLLFLK